MPGGGNITFEAPADAVAGMVLMLPSGGGSGSVLPPGGGGGGGGGNAALEAERALWQREKDRAEAERTALTLPLTSTLTIIQT